MNKVNLMVVLKYTETQKSLIANTCLAVPLIRHCTGQAFLMGFRGSRQANQRLPIWTPLFYRFARS
jgi:hypothetical protein